MKEFEKQGGIAFSFIFQYGRPVLLSSYPGTACFWERMVNGGRKSFRREELQDSYYLKKRNGFWCRIWKEFKKTWKTGIDIYSDIDYNLYCFMY